MEANKSTAAFEVSHTLWSATSDCVWLWNQARLALTDGIAWINAVPIAAEGLEESANSWRNRRLTKKTFAPMVSGAELETKVKEARIVDIPPQALEFADRCGGKIVGVIDAFLSSDAALRSEVNVHWSELLHHTYPELAELPLKESAGARRPPPV